MSEKPDGFCPDSPDKAEGGPCGCQSRRTLLGRIIQGLVALTAGLGLFGVSRKIEAAFAPEIRKPTLQEAISLIAFGVQPNDPPWLVEAIEANDPGPIQERMRITATKPGLAGAIGGYCYEQKTCTNTTACQYPLHRQLRRCCCVDQAGNTYCSDWHFGSCSQACYANGCWCGPPYC